MTLIYPEFGQTEYIEAFDEYSVIDDHLKIMLGEYPPWDTSRKYKFDSVEVLYEDQRRHRLLPVDKSLTLLEVLQKDGSVNEFYWLVSECMFLIIFVFVYFSNFVQMATPKFFVMLKNSEFYKIFMKRYSEITV